VPDWAFGRRHASLPLRAAASDPPSNLMKDLLKPGALEARYGAPFANLTLTNQTSYFTILI
jgi:hypothetical protein